MPAAQAERTLEDALGGPKLEVGGTSRMEPLAHRSIRLAQRPFSGALNRTKAKGCAFG
jgi:hypothetical protein